MQLFVYYIGKPRDAHANAMAAEYLKRIERFVRCEMREIHPKRFDLRARHPSALRILLDPLGRVYDSPKFSELVGKAELEARDLVFVIGGADGFPADWREQAGLLLSLSALTYSHELARVMLVEQIYRAFTILRGHPYPK